jgi:hypothetical protein
MPQAEISTKYENKEFQVATATTDYNVKSSQSAFVKLHSPGIAKWVRIATDQEITVRFNTAHKTGGVYDADGITIKAGAQYIREAKLIGDVFHDCTTNVFITNASGVTANITVYLS